jgi:hypothetical protein
MIASALSGTRNAKNATTMHVIVSVASFLLLRFIVFAVCAKRFIVVVCIPSVVVVIRIVVFCRLSMRERERDEAIFERERTLGKEEERSLFLSLLDFVFL